MKNIPITRNIVKNTFIGLSLCLVVSFVILFILLNMTYGLVNTPPANVDAKAETYGTIIQLLIPLIFFFGLVSCVTGLATLLMSPKKPRN